MTSRLCACGCGQTIHSKNPRRIYMNDTHSRRAERAARRDHVAPGSQASASGPPPAGRESPPGPHFPAVPFAESGTDRELPQTDSIHLACEAAALLFSQMPHVESVTVHRDGTLSILRAFPQSTPDHDLPGALQTLKAVLRPGAPSFEVR